MPSSSPSSVCVSAPSRSLTAMHGSFDDDMHVFAVDIGGTAIGALVYDEAEERSAIEAQLQLSDDMPYLESLHSSSLSEKTIFGVISNRGETRSAMLAQYMDDKKCIEELLRVEHHPGSLCFFNWQSSTTAISLDGAVCRLWNIDRSSSSLCASDNASVVGTADSLVVGCADTKHHPERFVAGASNDIHVFDVRASKQSAIHIPFAHRHDILSIDVNPNRAHIVASCGKDACIRFWDVRHYKAPLKQVFGHSHWVWSVKYNTLHDQLVLSGSGDCTARLWNLTSISSAPDAEAQQESNSSDRLLHSYDSHEDTVYNVCWSSSDAWVFACISFEGLVAINHVPSADKYRILL